MKGKLKANWKIGDKQTISKPNRNRKIVKFHVRRIKEKSGKHFRLNWTEPIKGLGKVWGDKGDREFRTDEEVLDFINQWESDERVASGVSGQVLTSLVEKEVRDAEHAKSLFEGRKLPTFSEMAKFWIDYRVARESPTLKKAFEKWLEVGRNERGLRERSMENRNRIRAFVDKFGDKKVGFISAEDIKPFVFRKGYTEATKLSQFAQFQSLFNFCLKREWLLRSPTTQIESPTIRPQLIEYYKLDEVRDILDAAKNHKGGVMLAYVTLIFFSGIRPAEVHRGRYGRKANKENAPLSWESLHLESQEPLLIIEKPKGDYMRKLSLEANAVLLLRKAKKAGFKVFPEKNGRRFMEELVKESGVKWIPDGARHTCLSALFSRDKKLHEIAAIAGNSRTVLEKHYINPNFSSQDGEDYFKIGVTEKELYEYTDTSGISWEECLAMNEAIPVSEEQIDKLNKDLGW